MDRSKIKWLVALIASLLVLVIAFVMLGDMLCSGLYPTTPAPTVTTAPTTTTSAAPTVTTVPTQPLPTWASEFAASQATNSDVYAWLYVPNTNINYPVLCASDQDDSFYLNHNIHKTYEFAGCIYSEKQNGRALSDRNTLIYGHNMLNGTMFRTLHYFEDETFFNDNPEFYIYTPGHILTYTIFAAYEYDNRHILNSFNFADDAVWEEYLAYATNPKSMVALTRDVEVGLNDRIVTLSTCVGTNPNARYLVQGVLTSDQPTQ